MIKIAICDAGISDRNRLQGFIHGYEKAFSTKFCLKLFSSGEELLQSRFLPHILFIDIAVGKKDGIQIGVEIKQKKAETIIIYTTLLREKISEAINRVHSFGFLEKPIDKDKMFQILSDAVVQVQYNCHDRQEELRFVSDSKTIIHLRPVDIYYFEYMDRRIKIAVKDNTLICRGKINEIADRMEEYGFMMPHQSFVVNLLHIEKISAQMLVLSNGEMIPLAQKRASAFRKKVMQTAQEETNKGSRLSKNIVE